MRSIIDQLMSSGYFLNRTFKRYDTMTYVLVYRNGLRRICVNRQCQTCSEPKTVYVSLVVPVDKYWIEWGRMTNEPTEDRQDSEK